MKKLLTIFSLVLALVMIFASCAPQENTKEPTTAPTTAPSAETTATPEPTATAEPTATPEPTPEVVWTEYNYSLEKTPDIWGVFGTSIIQDDGDAKVPGRAMLLRHIPDCDYDTQYMDGGYLTLVASEDCVARISVYLACPDAINGASGYFLPFCVNDEFNEGSSDVDHDIIDLEGEKETALFNLQWFSLPEIKLHAGENKIYFFQGTNNFAGGWRIALSSVNVQINAGSLEKPTELPDDKIEITIPAEGIKLDAVSYYEIIGAQTESCVDELAECGRNFGYMDPGAKITYMANIEKAGKYVFKFRVSSPATSPCGDLDICVDDNYKASWENDMCTEGWQNWVWSENTCEVELPEGKHTISFEVIATGSFNLGFIEVVPA